MRPIDFYIKALQYLVDEAQEASQADIARGTGIPYKRVNEYVRGRRTIPEDSREKIAEHLGHTYEEMLAIGRRLTHGEESQAKESKTEDLPGDEEAIEMTREILKNKGVYRPALLSNIKAFHKAVKKEEQMEGILREEMRKMEERYQGRMDRLEKMIESLGGQIPEKKSIAS